jgi:protein-tyrosine phosphatase
MYEQEMLEMLDQVFYRKVVAVKAFMEANPAYLGAAFDAIDREHGSFETYLHNGLGLSQKEIEHLKNLYLD